MSRLPFAFALVALSSAAQPAGWTLDIAATELAVKVWKTGAGASLAHDHVVVATKFSGTGSLDDAGKPESLRLELVVDTNSLVPDEPEARRKYYLPNTPVPEDDRKKVRANLLADDQLDAAKFPTIGFVVSKVYAEESGALQCLGKLTLHGVTKELQFPIKVKTGDRQVAGDASVRFKTSDFGIKPYSAALGLIKNKDEVELVVHVVLKR
jgi:polyisoprenoid-binding protein YceI